MPMITIEYDNAIVSDQDIETLSHAVQKIVADATSIEDVFVYANSAHIKIKIAPIEIFVQMSASKVSNIDELFSDIKTKLISRKEKSNFQHKINLTLIPMHWKFETGI